MKRCENHALRIDRALAVLDSEWTSINPRSTRMVSLAIARLEADGSASMAEWVFNPERPIEPGAQRVHGIRDEMVAGKPKFREVAGEIEGALRGADIGGYNVITDLMVLNEEMEIAGRGFSMEGRRVVDAYRLWTLREPRKLADAYRRFVGELPEDARLHDAGGDTRLTVSVIEKVLGDGDVAEAHEQTMSEVVDLGRKFRLNENDVIVFTFGEHADKPAISYPDYLEWMTRRDFPEDTKRVCRRLIGLAERAAAERRRREHGQEPMPER